MSMEMGTIHAGDFLVSLFWYLALSFYISYWFPWIENLSLMSYCSSFKGMKQIDTYYVCHQSGTFSHFLIILVCIVHLINPVTFLAMDIAEEVLFTPWDEQYSCQSCNRNSEEIWNAWHQVFYFEHSFSPTSSVHKSLSLQNSKHWSGMMPYTTLNNWRYIRHTQTPSKLSLKLSSCFPLFNSFLSQIPT